MGGEDTGFPEFRKELPIGRKRGEYVGIDLRNAVLSVFRGADLTYRATERGMGCLDFPAQKGHNAEFNDAASAGAFEVDHMYGDAGPESHGFS